MQKILCIIVVVPTSCLKHILFLLHADEYIRKIVQLVLFFHHSSLKPLRAVHRVVSSSTALHFCALWERGEYSFLPSHSHMRCQSEWCVCEREKKGESTVGCLCRACLPSSLSFLSSLLTSLRSPPLPSTGLFDWRWANSPLPSLSSLSLCSTAKSLHLSSISASLSQFCSPLPLFPSPASSAKYTTKSLRGTDSIRFAAIGSIDNFEGWGESWKWGNFQGWEESLTESQTRLLASRRANIVASGPFPRLTHTQHS